MRKFTFDGYDKGWNAVIQGAIVGTVFVPDSCTWDDHTCYHHAHQLAALMAEGFTRKEAGETMENRHCVDVAGWRVVGARKIQ